MNEKTVSSAAVRQVLREYFNQCKRSPLTTLLGFSLPAIGSVLVSFVPPLAMAGIVNLVAEGKGVTSASIGLYVAAFAGSWALGEVFWRVGLHFVIKMQSIGLDHLYKEAFRRLVRRDYDFYADNFVGSLTKKTQAFARGFEIFTDTMIFNIVTNILPMIFAFIVLGRYSLWLPGILIAAFSVVLAIAIPIIRKRSKLVALRHAAGSKASGRLSDVMTNILAVKSFAKESHEEEVYGRDVDDVIRKHKKASDYQNLVLEVALSPMYVATNVIGLIAAIYFTQHLGLPVGAMVIIFTYYGQITRVFWEINRIYRNLESSISEAAEFTQLLQTPPAVQDAPDASTLKLADANITFSNANFKYGATADSPLFLNSFNLDIKAGQRVGLVGPSGGGKTTITKLLLRFVDLESGNISVDGQDIRTVTQESLREVVGYVPQEPLLFHRSLFENIAYGNEKATEAEVTRAAELARAHEFISVLPEGYQTLVGERGIKLSGGQRQRVAIARAILKNAPILILDEATSSLDSESEKYIQEGLWELMKDKTALVIAHRLSTIKHLDRIIVLEQGGIVQDGTHEELVAQEGTYATLWSHQSGGFIEE